MRRGPAPTTLIHRVSLRPSTKGDPLRHIPWGKVRGIALLAMLLVLILPGTAQAKLEGPCSGSADIGGVTYDASFDSEDNPIIVPENRDGLQIPYRGAITVQNTNYLGAVGIVIGPATINVADWGLEENDDDVRATAPDSVYTLGSQLNNIVGLYNLTAFHDADGGNCDADAMVKLEGSPLSTPIGIGATAGTVLTGAGLLGAGIPKKRP